MLLLFITGLALIALYCGFKNASHRKPWKLTSALLWSSLFCLYMGEQGTLVDKAGVLHEAGPLLPIGGLLLLLGLISMAILSLMKVCSYCCPKNG